ncbi:MAG: hypothetical protein Q7T93_08770 [Methylobacterium sp.]|uniref:hypothetical protein n=1 Tax=unclassified Methylobacterium TaxID=2615210 RepID=UPI000B1C95D6|nr:MULTISPECIES: hypothetical protein [unclassified Methylobacterium]MDO9426916.1 hypothetical protein [Methylobacterium sp.]
MDRFYRGIEVSLLGFSLLLGLGAILLPTLPGALPGTLPGETRLAVTLPMITVTATP